MDTKISFTESTLRKIAVMQEHRIAVEGVRGLVKATDFGPCQELIDDGYVALDHWGVPHVLIPEKRLRQMSEVMERALHDKAAEAQAREDLGSWLEALACVQKGEDLQEARARAGQQKRAARKSLEG